MIDKIIRKILINSNVLKNILHNHKGRAFNFIINRYTPIVENSGIKFYGLFQIPYDRGETLLTKEPDMIQFIEDNYTAEDVYYDIGANVGVYSLYAAKIKKVRVFSFEPESSNILYVK